jgi:hypothetical protein
MESYYHAHDLGKFSEMGKGNKDLWDKFMSYYQRGIRGGSPDGAGEGVNCPRRRTCRAMPPIASMPTRKHRLRRGRILRK